MSDEYEPRIEIELLKKDVTMMSQLFNKFDVTIEKMQEIASSLSRMVSLQEQRIETQEVVTKEVQNTLEMRRMEHNNDIKDLHSRITTVNRELTEKIEETEHVILQELQNLRQELKAEKKGIIDRLSQIEGWKWMLMGGLVVAVWVLARIDFTKLFT